MNTPITSKQAIIENLELWRQYAIQELIERINQGELIVDQNIKEHQFPNEDDSYIVEPKSAYFSIIIIGSSEVICFVQNDELKDMSKDDGVISRTYKESLQLLIDRDIKKIQSNETESVTANVFKNAIEVLKTYKTRL